MESNSVLGEQASPLAQAAVAMGTNRLKEMFSHWKSERMGSMRGWGLFCDRSKFGPPKIAEIYSRMKNNVQYFQTNYILVFVLLAIYCILTNFLFLIGLVLIAVLWFYVFYWRAQPVVIYKHEVTQKEKTIAIGVVSLLLCYWAQVGNVLFWLFGATITLVLLHALFHKHADDVDEFGFSSTFVNGQPEQV